LDSDGTRRRVELLSSQNGAYVGQLVFAPILKKLDPQNVIRTPFSLKLVNAVDPDNPQRRINLTIPLDRHGRMLINWLKSDFIDSFRRESVVMLYQLDEAESKIISLLETLDSFNLWDKAGNPLPFKSEVAEILNDYNEIKLYKNYLLDKCEGLDKNGTALNGGISEDEYNEYFTARKNFFDRVSSLIDGSYFSEINDRLDEMKSQLDSTSYQEAKEGIKNLYDNLLNEDEI